jgi:hypothetical protein
LIAVLAQLVEIYGVVVQVGYLVHVGQFAFAE